MIRTYRPGDEAGINALYEKVFGDRRSLEEWQWKFVAFSVGEPIIVVAELDGRIVGHAACLKIPGRFGGRDILMGERVDIMVDPDYQGKGIYKEIVLRMTEECRAQQIDVLYGFPAEKAKGVFLKTAGGEDLGNIPRFLAIKRPGALIGSKIPVVGKFANLVDRPYGLLTKRKSLFELKEYVAGSGDADVIDALYHRFAGSYPLHAVRDSAYIERRYLAHPARDYKVFVVMSGGEPVGYAVCVANSAANGLVTASIVDLWAAPDAAVLAGILRAIRNHLDAAAINCWAVPDSARCQALKRAGFRHINSPMPFVIKVFDSELDVSSLADWHLSQSDVDSY